MLSKSTKWAKWEYSQRNYFSAKYIRLYYLHFFHKWVRIKKKLHVILEFFRKTLKINTLEMNRSHLPTPIITPKLYISAMLIDKRGSTPASTPPDKCTAYPVFVQILLPSDI